MKFTRCRERRKGEKDETVIGREETSRQKEEFRQHGGQKGEYRRGYTALTGKEDRKGWPGQG